MYALPVHVEVDATVTGLPADIRPTTRSPRAAMSDLPPTPDDDVGAPPAPATHPIRPLKRPDARPPAPHQPPKQLSRPAVPPPPLASAQPAPVQPAATTSPSPLSAGSDPPPDLLPDASLLSPDSAVATTPSMMASALPSGSTPLPGPSTSSSSSDLAAMSPRNTRHTQGSDYFAFPAAGVRRKPRQHGHLRGAVSQDALDVTSLSVAHLRHWPSSDARSWGDSSLPGLAALGRRQPAFAAATGHPAVLATTGSNSFDPSSGPAAGLRRSPAPTTACASSRRPLLDPLDMSFCQAAATRPLVAPSTPPLTARSLPRPAPVTRPIPISPPCPRRHQPSRQESPKITRERTAQAWAGGVGHFAPGLRLKLLDVLDALVDHVPLPDGEGVTITAVEYGALHSRGHPLLQSFVSRLSARTGSSQPVPENARFFSILHTDMPGTDFREVMASNERDQVLAKAAAPHLADHMFESYTARAFGAPVAPPGTVRFGLSLMDLHWAHPRAAEVPLAGSSSAPPSPDEMPDIPFAGGFSSALPLPSPHPLTPPAAQQAQQGYFSLRSVGESEGMPRPGYASATLNQVLAEPSMGDETHTAFRPLSHGLVPAPPSGLAGAASAWSDSDPRPAQELSTFLSSRAREFAPGGILMVAYLAAPSKPTPPISALCRSAPDLPPTETRELAGRVPNSSPGTALPKAVFSAVHDSGSGSGSGNTDGAADELEDTHDFWAALTSLLAPCIQRLVSTALVGPDVARRMLALPLTLRTPQQTRDALSAQPDWDVVWSCGLEDDAVLSQDQAQAHEQKQTQTQPGTDWPESEWAATRVTHPAWAGLRGGMLTSGAFATELVELVKSIYEAHLRRVLRTRARFSQGTAAIVLDTLWDHLLTRVQDLRERDHPLLRLPVHVEICTLALQRRA